MIPPHIERPDWERALAYRKLYSTTGTERSMQPRIGVKLDTNAFKPYGAGVYLYFKLLEMLFYAFLLISLASLPTLLCNYKGGGLDMYGQ